MLPSFIVSYEVRQLSCGLIYLVQVCNKKQCLVACML